MINIPIMGLTKDPPLDRLAITSREITRLVRESKGAQMVLTASRTVPRGSPASLLYTEMEITNAQAV